MAGICISVGLDSSAVAGIVTPSVALPAVIGTAGYTLAISVDPGGGGFTLTLTIAPGPAQNFLVSAEQLEAAQHCLSDLAISGTGTVGQTLTAAPGLWIVNPALMPVTPQIQWYRGATPIAGATGLTHILTALDAGQSITCRETVGTTTVTSNAISVAALPTLTVARIGDFQVVGTLTATPSYTVDLTGYNAGDQIVFFHGRNIFATSATVGGAAATKLGTDDGSFSSGGRMSAFTYTLTAPGGPGTTITLTCTAASNAHTFSCHGIKGGAVSAFARSYNGSGGVISLPLTVAGAGSHVVAVGAGTVPITWTGVTLVDEDALPVSGWDSGLSLAEASGVGAGTRTITADNTGTGRHGLFAVAIQPS